MHFLLVNFVHSFMILGVNDCYSSIAVIFKIKRLQNYSTHFFTLFQNKYNVYKNKQKKRSFTFCFNILNNCVKCKYIVLLFFIWNHSQKINIFFLPWIYRIYSLVSYFSFGSWMWKSLEANIAITIWIAKIWNKGKVMQRLYFAV